MSSLSNIHTCESPQRVYNKYSNEFLYVGCRKCSSCLNKRAIHWIERIENECKLHRYSVFFTLTYDNEHLPYYSRVWNDDKQKFEMISNRSGDSGKVLPERFNDVSIPVTHFDKKCIAYACRDDIKLFFKRLRSRIDYYYKKNSLSVVSYEKRIRYFICSEYGPRTNRPHYHGIVWLDSEPAFRAFENFLSKSWQNGSVDYSIVQSSAASYVAKYVNGNSSLPEVLRTEFTRTFNLQSKKPCIGYCESDEAEIQREFYEESYGRVELDVATKCAVYVQPALSLESRYFPKCTGYRRVSDFEKLRVYSAAYDFVRFRSDKCIDFDKKELSDYLHSKFDSVVDIHCAYACMKWCESYNLTPEIYLYKLIKYYSNKELYLLKLMYEYQTEYVDGLHLPLYHLLDFDMTVFDRLPSDYECFELGFEECLKLASIFSSYGVDVSDLYNIDGKLDLKKVDCLHQYKSDFWRNNVARQMKLALDANKYKRYYEMIDSTHLCGH